MGILIINTIVLPTHENVINHAPLEEIFKWYEGAEGGRLFPLLNMYDV